MADVFTGYRPDLERKDLLEQDSAAYSQLMASNEWTEADLFSWWHIRNQGAKSSCRGHSLAANARLCYRMKAGAIDLDGDGIENEKLQDDFSPDWCYYHAQRQSGIRGDNGATIEGGKNVGLNIGIVREIDLPYQVRYEPSRINQSGLTEKASANKFGRYTLMRTAEECFDWVGSGQGGLDIGQVWPLPWVRGCLVKGLSRNARGGGHATAGGTLVRGATLKRNVPSLANEVKDDEWVLQCMNSHSEQAQFRGFYFVTMQGLAAMLEHPWTVIVGWSDMSVPTPRPFDFRKKSIYWG